MEQDTNAPNEERTAEESLPTNSEAGGEMDFESAVGQWESQTNAIKEITLPVRNHEGEVVGETSWRYKMLTEEERREIENAAVSIETKRNEEKLSHDSAAAKDKIIELGVVEGPPGFENRKAQRRAIPDHTKDRLSSAIDDFSEMPSEVREGF